MSSLGLRQRASKIKREQTLNSAVTIRALEPSDRPWVKQFMVEHWCGEEMAVHGGVIYPAELPGFVCLLNGQTSGLVTYQIKGDDCEVMSLDSLYPNQGIGSALLEAVISIARQEHCCKIWLVTTNDNLNALGFYQKRGFYFTAVIPGAVEESRKRKPSIPEIGLNGIPLRDEIVLTKQPV